MNTTPWRQVQAGAVARMTPAERSEYDAAAEDAELGLRLAEIVYDARTSAGLSQTELAQRMGTRQSVISQIEGGGQVPTVAMLARVARATGQHLQIDILAEAS
jgi:ribosome-binding protein aMBF1 (putative translation factor)